MIYVAIIGGLLAYWALMHSAANLIERTERNIPTIPKQEGDELPL